MISSATSSMKGRSTEAISGGSSCQGCSDISCVGRTRSGNRVVGYQGENRRAATYAGSMMTRAHKVINLIGVPAPLVGLLVAIALLWNRAVGPLELGLLIGLYVITCLGVTLGYHRMFTHRSFESSRAFRAIIAVIGSMAVEGSVITWVADHRKHHAFTDHEGDPHSPHLSGPGFWGGVKGLWHAHIGWLFETVGQADRERFAPDMVKDRVLRIVDKTFFFWVGLSFAIPFALGWVI